MSMYNFNLSLQNMDTFSIIFDIYSTLLIHKPFGFSISVFETVTSFRSQVFLQNDIFLNR